MTRLRRSESGDETATESGLVVPSTEKVELSDDEEASKLLLLPLDVINSEEEVDKDDLSNDIDGMIKVLWMVRARSRRDEPSPGFFINRELSWRVGIFMRNVWVDDDCGQVFGRFGSGSGEQRRPGTSRFLEGTSSDFASHIGSSNVIVLHGALT